MKDNTKQYLDSRMTYLLVLILFVYALFVCYSCYAQFSGDIDFGVVASMNSETVWRVSE